MHLCFHGIGTPGPEREDGEARYWIGVETFLRVLDVVAERPGVRLSFDDGNSSDTTMALGALHDRGLVADFFPIADRLDRAGSVSSADLRALVAAGMRVGSHGMHHRPWRGLDAASLGVELDDARGLIAEAAGAPVSHVACPLGSYDRAVLGALRRRGYTEVLTSDRSRARRGAWLQPRFSVRAVDGVEDVRSVLDHHDTAVRQLTSRARLLAKSLR